MFIRFEGTFGNDIVVDEHNECSQFDYYRGSYPVKNPRCRHLSRDRNADFSDDHNDGAADDHDRAELA
jgi:hypothetical protein